MRFLGGREEYRHAPVAIGGTPVIVILRNEIEWKTEIAPIEPISMHQA